MHLPRSNMRRVLVALVVAALLVGLAVGLYFALRPSPEAADWPAPSQAVMGVYSKAAVATNGYLCADIGSEVMKKGGNAVDAAIAALFCEGVICLQSMGIGGGFLMTIYSRDRNEAIALNARETAPAAAYEDMYHGNSTLSRFGGMAVGVPGELKGYWEAFQKYGSGKVSWRELILPSIDICNNGFKVSSYLANVLESKEESIKMSETLSDILINPATGKVWKVGDTLRRPSLGVTLMQIAESYGVDIFYNGTLGQKFIDDVTELGGIMKMSDLQNYTVRWEKPVSVNLSDNITLYSSPLPGSGPLLAFIFNILDEFIPTSDEVTTYQRITEAFKFAYGRRTELGDPDFNETVSVIAANLTSRSYAKNIRSQISDSMTYNDPEYYGAVLSQPDDHGTAHISVIDQNGNAVSVTSTVNLIFGAMVVSKQTGIILNDEMDDFSAPNITNAFGIPPSPANFIKPGKMPLSSMTPAIFVNGKGDVRLVAGAAGGTKITTGTALVSMYNLWFNKTIKEAIDHRRIHHQLFPMRLQYEEGFKNEIMTGLERIGHEVEQFSVGGSTVTGIAVSGGKIYANADFRRNGVVAGF